MPERAEDDSYRVVFEEIVKPVAGNSNLRLSLGMEEEIPTSEIG